MSTPDRSVADVPRAARRRRRLRSHAAHAREGPRRRSLALVHYATGSSLVLLFAVLVPRYMQAMLKVSPDKAVTIFAPVGIGAILGLRALPWIAARFGKNRTVIIGICGLAICRLASAPSILIAQILQTPTPQPVLRQRSRRRPLDLGTPDDGVRRAAWASLRARECARRRPSCTSARPPRCAAASSPRRSCWRTPSGFCHLSSRAQWPISLVSAPVLFAIAAVMAGDRRRQHLPRDEVVGGHTAAARRKLLASVCDRFANFWFVDTASEAVA